MKYLIIALISAIVGCSAPSSPLSVQYNLDSFWGTRLSCDSLPSNTPDYTIDKIQILAWGNPDNMICTVTVKKDSIIIESPVRAVRSGIEFYPINGISDQFEGWFATPVIQDEYTVMRFMNINYDVMDYVIVPIVDSDKFWLVPIDESVVNLNRDYTIWSGSKYGNIGLSPIGVWVILQ